MLIHTTGALFIALYFYIKCFYSRSQSLVIESIILVFATVISAFLATNTFVSNVLSSIFGATWRVGKYNIEMQLGVREIGEGVLGIFIWLFYRIKCKSQIDKWCGFLTWLFVLTRFMTINFRIMYRVADCFIVFFLVAALRLAASFEKKKIAILLNSLIIVFYAVFFFFKIKGYTSFHGYKLISFFDLFR